MIFFNRKFYDENTKIHFLISDNFGISISKAFFLCNKAGLKGTLLLKDIENSLLRSLEYVMVTYYDFSKLRKRLFEKQLKNQFLLGTYRGRRMALGLPVRGQRTHSNAKTAKRLKPIKLLGNQR
jgi:small subunit ribosomal protein S13